MTNPPSPSPARRWRPLARNKTKPPRNVPVTTAAPGEGIFEITRWACVNWHNLLTQDQAVVGDIFNLGPNESGKTTLLDGLHFALSFGEPHMEWNSAADPNASEAKLKREGRTLKDVIFRVNEHTQNETPNIVYFAVEVKNRTTDEVYSIAVGAYAATAESDAEKWGLILPKPLRDVQLLDATTETVHDRDKLEETYGTQNVYGVMRFRQKMSEIFFGSVDDYDQVLKLWKLGKSYNRLVQQSDNFAALFRQALPRPDPADFDSARSQLDTIRGIRAAIQSITQQRDDLTKVEGELKTINRQRAAIARYNLRDTTNEIELADVNKKKAQGVLAEIQAQRAQLDQQESETRAELREKEGLISDLQAAGVDELSQATESARRELEAAAGRLSEANRDQAGAAAKLGDAAKIEEKAWDDATYALKSVSQAIETQRALLPKGASAGFGAVLHSMNSALTSVQREEPTLSEKYGEAVDALRVLVDQHREQLLGQLQRAEAEAQRCKEEAQQKRDARENLARHKDVPPDARLPAAVRGIERSVVALYAGIEIHPGREQDAALLEAYLGPINLSAILPLENEQADRVRRHVQARAHDLKVVDAVNLRTPSIPHDSILQVIQLERSHPLATAYLTSEFADIRLRNADDPRRTDERVIWRNGEVYDTHAWILPNVRDRPLFLGKEAREETTRAAIAKLDEEISALDERAREAAKTAKDAAARRGVYQSIATEIQSSYNRHRVDAKIQHLASSRSDLTHARSNEQRESARLERERREWSARRGRLETLETQARETGVDKKIDALADARARATQLHATLEKVSNARGAFDTRATQENASLTAAEIKLKEFTPRRQAQFEELKILLRLTGPEVDAYLRENQFHRIKHTPQSKRTEASETIGAAKSTIESTLIELSAKRSLRYDFETNTVTESVGGRPLQLVVDEIEKNLEAKHLEDVEATRILSEKIIVEGIAARIKDDVTEMDGLLDKVNEALKNVEFRGTRYKIQALPIKDPRVAQIRRLVLEASAEASQENLADFIRLHLEATTPVEGDVPQLFDYRRWYDFRIVSVSVEPDADVKDRTAKGSGGRQAVPKYLFCFCLFSILYDRLGSRLRLVLIDEAFQRIDPGNIDQLIRFAKTRELCLIVTNPDLDGATESMQASTVNMFHKNELNECFVERWTKMATAIYVRRSE